MTLFEVPKVPWLLRFMKLPGYLWNFPIGCFQGPLGASFSEVPIVPCLNIYCKRKKSPFFAKVTQRISKVNEKRHHNTLL